mmetsp:Transcript_8837/g.13113  ORF Transcript_8837/g.13113 Transcript_8837/m.13113 type:complete len:409 (+) Transcript_8837:123-1349(+)
MKKEELVNHLRSLKETTSGTNLEDIIGSKQNWTIASELSGGNVNFTYVMEGEEGKSVIVKHSMPYIKILEDWKLDTCRSGFEVDHLLYTQERTPEHVPQIYHYDKEKAIIVMKHVKNALTMRQSMLKEQQLDDAANHVATFLANSLFFSSDLALSIDKKYNLLQKYAGNYQLVAITDQVIMSEPYIKGCPNNSWDEVHNQLVDTIQNNMNLKNIIRQLRERFRNHPQALCHGDAHTGSILVTTPEQGKHQTYFIDPEFCFFGPMGFDIGLFVGNTLISIIVNQHKHNKLTYNTLLSDFWMVFETTFSKLMDTSAPEEANISNIYTDKKAWLKNFMNDLFIDTLAFAGCAMVRRIIGVASCLDMNVFGDQELKQRQMAERKVMQIGEQLIENYQSKSLTSMEDVMNLLK